MRSTPAARIASSTTEVATVFCSRSIVGWSNPWRTSAFAAKWNTVSQPVERPPETVAVEHVALDEPRRPRASESATNSRRPRGEVVEIDDLDAVGAQAVGERAADEARLRR